jgi:ABC-type Fe3+/spermidine/putrescine transport system ATPase subunit
LKALQRSLGATFIYVTHDQDEALSMSDRLAVMRAGRIEQLGAPSEVYHSPKTIFAASFLGSCNLLRATVIAPGRIKTEFGVLDCDTAGRASGSNVTAGIRPEKIAFTHSDQNCFSGVLTGQTFSGAATEITARLGEIEIRAAALNSGPVVPLETGESRELFFPANAIFLLDQ